ncbi:MAG: inovirus-type Gp2 protein [Victivallaceae bacterium]|nr:inovirus-type Gp2 protein [Victivallaceae bacterium]
MRDSDITFSKYYRGLEIQASETLPCRKDILEATHRIFELTAFKHRTFFMRFDVTFPKSMRYPPDNSLFIGFIASFMKNLRRNKKKLNPHLLWVRENNPLSGPNHHYHCFMCLAGDNTHSIFGHLTKAQELWELALGLAPGQGAGLIDYCNRGTNGYMIERGDFIGAAHCFYWASYLSKCRTKEYLPGIRTFNTSQL